MFFKTCLAVFAAFVFFAGSAFGAPLYVNNAFVCATRDAVTKIVEYETTIMRDGTEVTMADYDNHVRKIGCKTYIGAAIEKHAELLRYTGVYPMAGTWVPAKVVVVRAKVRVLATGEEVEGFVFLPAGTKFPGVPGEVEV